ncbi:hypothetical protein MTO96_027309 [Rhipicephalus appendiculatus]
MRREPLVAVLPRELGYLGRASGSADAERISHQFGQFLIRKSSCNSNDENWKTRFGRSDNGSENSPGSCWALKPAANSLEIKEMSVAGVPTATGTTHLREAASRQRSTCEKTTTLDVGEAAEG